MAGSKKRQPTKSQSEPEPGPVPDAEPPTQPSPPDSSSLSNSTSPVVTYDSTSPGQQGPISSSGATHVDTSGLILVDKAWMEAMELSVKAMSDKLLQLTGQAPAGGPSTPSPNGQPQPNGQPGLMIQNGNGGGGFWGTVDKIATVAQKIIEKIPQNAFGGGSNIETQFAQRYMNLLDTAYGRYMPPIVQPPPVVQHMRIVE